MARSSSASSQACPPSVLKSAALNNNQMSASSQSKSSDVVSNQSYPPSTSRSSEADLGKVQQSLLAERAPFCLNVVEHNMILSQSSERMLDSILGETVSVDSVGDAPELHGAVHQNGLVHEAAPPTRRVSKFKASRQAQGSI